MKVFLMAAITADGFIARRVEQAADWTSSEDKKLFARITKEAGVMVMGSRTFDTIGKALPGRRNLVYTSRPERYKMAGVETTHEDPTALVRRLQTEGCKALAVIGGSQIYDLFLQAGLVSELYLTVEPLLFGRGISLLRSATEVGLELLSAQKLGENAMLLHYKLKHGEA